MRFFLILLTLTFCVQSHSIADDIQDLEIEGMSIGDSLLDYVNKRTINTSRKYEYDDEKFYTIDLILDKFKNYYAVQIHLKKNDQNKKMSEIIRSLPVTYQTPTMAPYCRDEEKYNVVDEMIKEVKKLKDEGIKIDNQNITEVLTINGVRFSLEDGSWGLIRASSNKPSLVIVTESTKSDESKKKIFKFIDNLLQKTGKIGDYDQKI